MKLNVRRHLQSTSVRRRSSRMVTEILEQASPVASAATQILMREFPTALHLNPMPVSYE